MPIGTANTQLLMKIKPATIRTSEKTKQNNFWVELFTFIAVQVAVGILAPFTGGLSETIALSYGLSELSASIISAGVSFGFDFLANQVYDTIKNQNNTENTILNLLPGLSYISPITRGARATKVLKIANDTKLLEKWGINYAPNFQKLGNQLKNQKILTKDKYLWDFTESVNKETLLTNLSSLSMIEFQSQFKNLSLIEIQKFFSLQEQVRKIHPSLVPKVKIYNRKSTEKFLQELGTTIQQVSLMSYEEFLSFTLRLQEFGKGSNLIIALYQVRETLAKENFLIQFHKKWLLAKKSLNKINPKFQIRKILNEKLKKLKDLETLAKERIKIQKNKFFQKFEEKALIKGQLLPLKSEVFLGYRTRNFGLSEDVALTIFYRNPKYKPITVITTIDKVTEFVLSASPFRYYMYESDWSFGWGIKKNKIIKVINFLPSSVQLAIIDSYKVWMTISKLLQQSIKIKKIIENGQSKNEITKYVTDLSKYTVNTLTSIIIGRKLFKVIKTKNLTKVGVQGRILRISRSQINKRVKKYRHKKAGRF